MKARRAGAQRAAFTALDEAYYRAVHRAEAPERDAGATALAALVWGGRLVVANAGDSRAVLSRRGRAINLSRDHKPSCPSERERVATAGARPPRRACSAHAQGSGLPALAASAAAVSTATRLGALSGVTPLSHAEQQHM